MHNKMLVSIVIPVYNTEKFIKECIESVLRQTYDKIEVIAVDDGSTDNSLKILNQFSGKIKIISKSNGGTASALNAGIKEMKGEWFKWLSADDLLLPNSIQELVNEIDKLENKNYILYSNYNIIDSEGKIIKEFIEPNYNSKELFEINTILLDHFIGNATTSLIHRSAFDKHGLFDENVDFGEDYEMWLRLCILHKYRLHLVPKILAGYRVHGTQLSAKKMNKALENSEIIRNQILDKLDKEEKEKFLVALNKLKKTKPFSVKVRRIIRDLMLKTLPKSSSDIIIQEYLKRKQR